MKNTGPEIMNFKNTGVKALSGGNIAASTMALCMICVSQPALAAGTIAGTPIDNTATATYDGPDGPVDVDSNQVTIIVDELLDVTVVSDDPGDVATQPGAEDQVLKYTITNTGNGNEAFTLTPDVARGGDDFDPELVQVVLDSNNNGVYDPGVDQVYVKGTNDPLLSPDDSITVFVITDIPDGADDTERGEVNLLAEAVTGTGAPGDSFDGQGDGGGDAVVGTTGADDDASGFFVIQNAAVALIKSFEILDPFGGEQSVPGATITYTLTATVTGTGTLNGLKVSDIIPDDTSYVIESITLESAPLTDSSADADAGQYDGTAISVDLGDVPGGQTRTVTFKVTID